MLSSSGARLGWPPQICVSTASFSLNSTTCRKYARILGGWQRWVRINCACSVGSARTRSISHRCPSTGHVVRLSHTKLQPAFPSTGLSYSRPHGIAGGGWSAAHNSSWSSSSRVVSTSPWMKPRKSPMVKRSSLYSSSSVPCHVIWPGVVLL